MKKLIAALLTLAVSLPAFAQWGGFYSSKAGGGGCTAGSACSGTTIAATTQFAAPAGTVSVPAITLAGDASGWYRNASNQWTWTNSTDPYLSIFQSGTSRVRLHPSMAISWTASTSVTAEDTVISRYAAKQLMISGDGVGTDSAQTSWVLGNQTSATAGLWVTGATPTLVFRASSTYTFVQSGSGGSVYLAPAGTNKAEAAATAGAGLAITAGTTADNTQRALSITQTWTNGTSSNKAILANITVGTGTGNLLEVQAGGAAKFYVTEAGNTTTAGNMIAAGALQSQYWNSSDNSFTGMQIITATGNVQVYQQLIPKSYAVESLPTGVTGGIVQVSDASACPAKGSAVSAGGSAKCIVYYNGSAWVGI